MAFLEWISTKNNGFNYRVTTLENYLKLNRKKTYPPEAYLISDEIIKLAQRTNRSLAYIENTDLIYSNNRALIYKTKR